MLGLTVSKSEPLSDLFAALFYAVLDFVCLILLLVGSWLCVSFLMGDLLRINVFAGIFKLLVTLFFMSCAVIFYFKPTIIASNINRNWFGCGLVSFFFGEKYVKYRYYFKKQEKPKTWLINEPDYKERHPHIIGIFLINLFFGFTGLVWILVNFWAYLGVTSLLAEMEDILEENSS